MPEQPRTREASPTPRRPRACEPCSKAKSRCNWRAHGVSGCERCHRLKIYCQLPAAPRLRKPRKANSVPSPTSSRTQTGDSPGGGHSGSPVVTLSDFSQSPSRSQSAITPQSQDRPVQLGHVSQPEPRLSQPEELPAIQPNPRLGTNIPDSPGFGLLWDDARHALKEYKSKYMPNFPFVFVGEDTSAEELFLEKPLLFRVIILVAGPISTSKRKVIKRSVSAYIGQHIIVTEECQLSILQGLLAYIAWGPHAFWLDQQITRLTYLAVGYAHSLGITTKPPNGVVKETRVHTQAKYGGGTRPVSETPASFEELRAFLGCYYLMSANSSQFGRHHQDFNDNYIDECLTLLAQASESWTDFAVAKIVRLQQLVERVSKPWIQTPPRLRLSQSNSFAENETRAELDMWFRDIKYNNRLFSWFWVHYNYILVLLDSTALQHPLPKDPADRRARSLACLQSARSFFTTVFSLGAETFLYRPFILLAELRFVISLTSRILLLGKDEQQLQKGQQALDLPSVLAQLEEAFATVSMWRARHQEQGSPTARLPTGDVDNEQQDEWVQYLDEVKWARAWLQSQSIPQGTAPRKGPNNPGIGPLNDAPERCIWLGALGGRIPLIDAQGADNTA